MTAVKIICIQNITITTKKNQEKVGLRVQSLSCIMSQIIKSDKRTISRHSNKEEREFKKKQHWFGLVIWSCLISVWSEFSLTCSFPLYFQLALAFFSLAIVLPTSVSLSLHSSSEPTPRQAVRPRGGSNQLNYWEHKNAAANGSWINTLAKLLLWLPLAAMGHQTKKYWGWGCSV